MRVGVSQSKLDTGAKHFCHSHMQLLFFFSIIVGTCLLLKNGNIFSYFHFNRKSWTWLNTHCGHCSLLSGPVVKINWFHFARNLKQRGPRRQLRWELGSYWPSLIMWPASSLGSNLAGDGQSCKLKITLTMFIFSILTGPLVVLVL